MGGAAIAVTSCKLQSHIDLWGGEVDSYDTLLIQLLLLTTGHGRAKSPETVCGMSSSLQFPENRILRLHLHIANTGVTAHYCTLQSGAGEPSVA